MSTHKDRSLSTVLHHQLAIGGLALGASTLGCASADEFPMLPEADPTSPTESEIDAQKGDDELSAKDFRINFAGKIISAQGDEDMCLDVPNGNTDNGTALQLWQCAGGNANQVFALVPHPNPNPGFDGFYQIKHQGKCLDVRGKSTANRAIIQLWQCSNGSSNQAFKPVGGEPYQLEAKHSGKCIDVRGYSTDNGATIWQYSCHGEDNQLWYLPE